MPGLIQVPPGIQAPLVGGAALPVLIWNATTERYDPASLAALVALLPAPGSDTQVIFNDGGFLAGATATWDKTNRRLTLNGAVINPGYLNILLGTSAIGLSVQQNAGTTGYPFLFYDTTGAFAWFGIDVNGSPFSSYVAAKFPWFQNVNATHQLDCSTADELHLRLGTASAPEKRFSCFPLGLFRMWYDASNYALFTVSSGGVLTIAPSGGDTVLTLADNTTGNASTSKHGWQPKLSNVATEYLSGTGVYSTPSGKPLAVTVISAASGTFTVTSGARFGWVRVWGPGGGGAGVGGVLGRIGGAGGGGAGGFAEKFYTTWAGTYSYVAPAGGAGGAAGANNGTAGANTTAFGSIAVNGGAGGTAATAGTTLIAAGGAGAVVGSGGDINSGGAPGDNGIAITTAYASGSGGSSAVGGGGAQVVSTAADGNAASGFCAGGSGGATTGVTNHAGGAGTGALIIVVEW